MKGQAICILLVGYFSMALLPPFRAVEAAIPSADEDPIFLRGQELFDRDFNRKDGVGAPEMNADSCRACHQDPVMGGAGPLEVNVSRFASDNGGWVLSPICRAGRGSASCTHPMCLGARSTRRGSPMSSSSDRHPRSWGMA